MSIPTISSGQIFAGKVCKRHTNQRVDAIKTVDCITNQTPSWNKVFCIDWFWAILFESKMVKIGQVIWELHRYSNDHRKNVKWDRNECLRRAKKTSTNISWFCVFFFSPSLSLSLSIARLFRFVFVFFFLCCVSIEIEARPLFSMFAICSLLQNRMLQNGW